MNTLGRIFNLNVRWPQIQEQYPHALSARGRGCDEKAKKEGSERAHCFAFAA
jgi:hypothetical protein